MKKLVSVLLASTVFCALVSGCQPATKPTADTIGKDVVQMIENAQKAPGRVLIPDEYQGETISNETHTLIVNVEAQVLAPREAALPTLLVDRHIFTGEESAAFVTALFEGQKTYSGEISETKADILLELQNFRSLLAAETEEQARRELEGSIAKCEMAIGMLPEGEGMVETPAEFRTTHLGEQMFLVSDGSDGFYRAMFVNNYCHEKLNTFSYSIGRDHYPVFGNLWDINTSGGLKHGIEEFGDPSLIPASTITEQEAVQKANDLLQKLSINDYEFGDASVVFGLINGQVQKAYRLRYTRKVGDALFTITDFMSGGAIDDGQGGYIWGWEYESLTFIVADNDVLSMEWTNPYDITETVAEDTSILSFEEVTGIFEKMIIIQNDFAQDGVTMKIDIHRIELGLMRVTDANTRSIGLVIPVWDFFGTVTYKHKNGEVSVSDHAFGPLLTINAIDGSSINRGLGY